MWLIIYIDDKGLTTHHEYKPRTKQEALQVGDELTRDHVAQFFRVQRIKAGTGEYRG